LDRRNEDVHDRPRLYVIVHNTRSAAAEDEHRATLTAQSRLNQAPNHLRSEGLDAHGDIGDPEPLTAIEDALAGQKFDEIIISTLPSGISHWLRVEPLPPGCR